MAHSSPRVPLRGSALLRRAFTTYRPGGGGFLFTRGVFWRDRGGFPHSLSFDGLSGGETRGGPQSPWPRALLRGGAPFKRGPTGTWGLGGR